MMGYIGSICRLQILFAFSFIDLQISVGPFLVIVEDLLFCVVVAELWSVGSFAVLDTVDENETITLIREHFLHYLNQKTKFDFAVIRFNTFGRLWDLILGTKWKTVLISAPGRIGSGLLPPNT